MNIMENKNRLILGSILGVCCFLFASSVFAQLSATELDRLFASDATNGDNLGAAVDVDGDRAVIGSRFDDDVSSNAGAVYVYLRNPDTQKWSLEDKLFMTGGEAGDNFGSSVAIDGDVIVVGAPQDDINEVAFKGSAHVFTRGPGGWDDGVELLPGDENENPVYENYGISVDIDNGTIVVGVAYDDEVNGIGTSVASGSAYVYEKGLEDWTMTARLLPPGTEDNQNFGWSVAIDRDTILIGAPHWTASGVGEAYVFDRFDDVWQNTAEQLPATDNLMDDNFGWSVAISGNLIVVGARLDDDAVNGDDSGSITIFGYSSGDYINQGKLLASNGEANDYFGISVATNGEVVVAGAQKNGRFSEGRAYFFVNTEILWVEVTDISPPRNASNVSAVQHFGSSVALDGATLVVGAPTSDVFNDPSFIFVAGAAFAYGINTTGITSFDGLNNLAIQSPPGTYLTDVIAIDPATLGGSALNVSSPLGVNLRQDVSFPLGALGFKVNGLTPGAAIEVDLDFPEEVSVSSYFKFSDDWYEFLDDGTTGATMTPGKITLKFVDGGRGDHDGIANGVIEDPGAPGVIIISDTLFADGFED